jgi:hypothetical protein
MGKDKILYGGKPDDVSDWLAVTSDRFVLERKVLSLASYLRKSASHRQFINLIPYSECVTAGCGSNRVPSLAIY